MLYYFLPYLISLALIIHIIKTGRNTLWIWLVIFAPFIGALAYFIIEIVPGMTQSHTARRAKSTLRNVVDPARDLRQAQQKLRVNDSVDSRRKFADELYDHGRFNEAIEHYRAAMTGIYTHEPLLMLGIARSQFAGSQFTEVCQTLDELFANNPGFKSPDGQLLYARALEGTGKAEQALKEYAALVRHHAGAEAIYRYGMLLKRTGQVEQAHTLFRELLLRAEAAGRNFRNEQREWLEAARRELGQV